MPVIVLTVFFLALTGFVWHERPSGGLWLGCSLGLGLLWGAGFFWLITRPKT